MNCKEFETRLIDGEMSDTALLHAGSCEPCAARLADTDSLRAVFRVIAENDAAKQAPERLEANLLAAFRQQTGKVVAMPQPRIVSAFQWSRWLLAAAVVIVVLLAFFAWRVPEKSLEGREARGAKPQPAHPVIDEKPTPVMPSGNTAPPQKLIVTATPKQKHVPTPEMQNASLPTNQNKTSSSPSATDTGSNGEQGTRMEIATDFMPLQQGYSLPMTEGGQLMRVELPRSVLSSFGLPVDFNRASERIKADVVIGNDGIARAIRFVR